MKNATIVVIAILVLFSCSKTQKDVQIFVQGNPPKNTILLSHPGHRIEINKNYIWCSTIQIAWNDLCKKIGEDIHADKETPDFKKMNRRTYKKEDIDPASYFVMEGYNHDIDRKKMIKEMEDKFGNDFYPGFIDTSLDNHAPDAFIVYAHLKKTLTFEYPFTRDVDSGLTFLGTRVESFNPNHSKLAYNKLISQIKVYSYKNDDDFIIGLNSKSKNDMIILAKIKPRKTLEATSTYVLSKITGSGNDFKPDDVFNAPAIGFDFNWFYPEFEDKILKVRNKKFNNLPMIIHHKIIFTLNGKGAGLESIDEAVVVTEEEIEKPRNFIFDEPFLVMMKERKSKRPYFSMWVGNPELFKTLKK